MERRGWLWIAALVVAPSSLFWIHRETAEVRVVTASPCETQGAAEAGASDLVVVTVDTLRADRLGAYGHSTARTPRLDALAASGVRFVQATTPIPRTTPALGTLFTGLRPGVHGSRDVGQPLTHGETLATVLCERGYATLGVSASWVAGPEQGLDRGFSRFLAVGESNAEQVTGHALAMAEQTPAGTPLFLWVHYGDPHLIYLPPRTWSDQPEARGCRRLMDELRTEELSYGQVVSNEHGRSSAVLADCAALYDAEVAYTDFHVGALLEGLRERRDPSRSVVVVTADHGENMGEGGLYYEHGPSLHDASLRVPLLMAGPGLAAGLVDDEVARLEDVMPTALALLGIPAREAPVMDGLDLSPRLRPGGAPPGWTGPRVALSEGGNALHVSLFDYVRSGIPSDVSCFNDVRYSLCSRAGGEPALHDHIEDPRLARDLSDALPEIKDRLAAAAQHWSATEPRARSARTPDFKLVEYPTLDGRYRRALYDLRTDPTETHDVSAQHPDIVTQLQDDLDRFAAALAPAPTPLAPENTRALEALGYID